MMVTMSAAPGIVVARAIVASGLSALPLPRGAAVGSARPGVEVGTRSGVSVVLASPMPVLVGFAVVVAKVVAGPE